MDDMNGKIEAVVDGGSCDVGIESTVITLAADVPRLLRPGGITLEQLEDVLGHVEVDPAVLSELKEGERPASPGMKYKHYSPKAEVYIVNGSLPSFLYQIDSDLCEGDAALCFEGEEKEIGVPCLSFGKQDSSVEQAHSLFDNLRKFDDMGVKRVFVRAPSADGVGLGVYNRLLRAAAFKILDPPLILGLTGQSGAGKTTVAAELERKGYLIVDGDIIARKAVEDTEVLKKLSSSFGEDIISADGKLIRSELAKRAFSSEQNRQCLNKITHPAITRLIMEMIGNSFTPEHKGVVIDAAAIFDCELPKYCTKMLVVVADKNLRAERIMKRDGIDRETAMLRINAQKSEQYYIERADIVIRNNGEESLSAQLKEL
jgi:L-threonylcarbamoyladenylate synthase